MSSKRMTERELGRDYIRLLVNNALLVSALEYLVECVELTDDPLSRTNRAVAVAQKVLAKAKVMS